MAWAYSLRESRADQRLSGPTVAFWTSTWVCHLGVAFAAGPVIEGGGGDAAAAEPVDAVVAPADPDRLLFQPAQHGSDGRMAGGLDFRPHLRLLPAANRLTLFGSENDRSKDANRASIRLPTCLRASV